MKSKEIQYVWSDYLHLNNPEVIDFQQLRDFHFQLSPQ